MIMIMIIVIIIIIIIIIIIMIMILIIIIIAVAFIIIIIAVAFIIVIILPDAQLDLESTHLFGFRWFDSTRALHTFGLHFRISATNVQNSAIDEAELTSLRLYVHLLFGPKCCSLIHLFVIRE